VRTASHAGMRDLVGVVFAPLEHGIATLLFAPAGTSTTTAPQVAGSARQCTRLPTTQGPRVGTKARAQWCTERGILCQTSIHPLG
jgi:hypothetical protein